VYGVRPSGHGARPATSRPKSGAGSQRVLDGATEPSRAGRLPPYSVPPSRPASVMPQRPASVQAAPARQTSVPPGPPSPTPIPVTTAVPPPLPAPTPPPATDAASAPARGAPSSATGTSGFVNPFPKRRRSSPVSVPREPPREIVLPVAQRVLAALDLASPNFREGLFVITADGPGQGGRFGVEIVAISAQGGLTSVDAPPEVIDAVGRMLAVDWGGKFQRLVGRLRPGESSASLDVEVRS
jgi:hypothetical protein